MCGNKIMLSLLGLFLLLQTGCTHSPDDNRLQIVSSITPLSYFAERIGGRYVSVSVMVPPGGDPHSYEPKPSQLVMLSHAILFIKAGSGIEFELDWMPRILSLNPGLRICDASAGATLLPMPKGERAEDADMYHEEHREHHRHGNKDPHFWLSPANAVTIVRNIAKALESEDPAHSKEYRANASRLEEELRALDREIQEKISGVTLRKFLVFHPAWGYFAHDYGLEQIAVEAEGKSLTPGQMRHVIDTAKKNGIRVVFISPQFNAQQAGAIAKAIGGKIHSVDPLASDYQDNLRRTTELFVKAGNE